MPVPTSRTLCPGRSSATCAVRTTREGSVADEVGLPETGLVTSAAFRPSTWVTHVVSA
ncbi:hypothetical protein GCM10010232_42470 [Streptomyces amakusaensis]